MNFRHFIITRFNLKYPGNAWDKDRLGNSVLTDEWLAARVDLFLKYCLPSVQNQSNDNFQWLIYFNTGTNDAVIKQFIELEQSKKNLKIMFADGYDDFMDRYCNDVLSFCNKSIEYVITTRLDNDDIVHRDFTSRIQAAFSGQNFTAINFVKILMIDTENRHKLFIDYSFSNHFISLIEKVESSHISGCYSKRDKEWNSNNEISHIIDKPYCIEIISERNLGNCFRGFPVFRKTDLSAFSLSHKVFSNSLSDQDNFKFWKMSWRKLLISKKMSIIYHLHNKEQKHNCLIR